MPGSDARKAAPALAGSDLPKDRLGGAINSTHIRQPGFSGQLDARALTKALRGSWHGHYGMARCPAHADRTPSLKIKDDARKLDGIDVQCFAGCPWQDVKSELSRQGLIADIRNKPRRWPHTAEVRLPSTILPPEIDDDTKQRVETAMQIWSASIPLAGTLGWKYFTERRGLHIGLLDDLNHCLRWHEGVDAVIALMTDAKTNAPTGIPRTFINPDGTKRSRMMLGKQGVIRLSSNESVTQGLGIVEGVEDGLAVLLSGWAPVWAATCANAMASFPLLSGIESLTVFADADSAGVKAAQLCMETYLNAGREAAFVSPCGDAQ